MSFHSLCILIYNIMNKFLFQPFGTLSLLSFRHSGTTCWSRLARLKLPRALQWVYTKTPHTGTGDGPLGRKPLGRNPLDLNPLNLTDVSLCSCLVRSNTQLNDWQVQKHLALFSELPRISQRVRFPSQARFAVEKYSTTLQVLLKITQGLFFFSFFFFPYLSLIGGRLRTSYT